MKKWETKEQLVNLLCDLVRIPSVTGSAGEVVLPGFVVQQLRSLPYFQAHPNHVESHPTGDGREFVTALVKQRTDVSKTVIMVSHFDVVDAIDYGSWESYAFDPYRLTSLFYTHRADMPAAVQKDLSQGNWLFGRGTMDMKCGLALHMAMIEQACHGAFDGNLLLLTVPDEEVNSAGMRAAVPKLLELAERHGLTYQAVLNSEPMFTQYPGDETNYIYTGSIGKVLPGFLCYGKETHVGEPFAGLNANFMASRLTDAFELNTDFCEVVGDEVTPPPTNLMQTDLKKEYSVQIPHRAVTMFNLFLYEKRMDELVAQLLAHAEEVAAGIKEKVRQQAERYRSFAPFTPNQFDVKVLTYEQLHAYALQSHGQDRLESIYQEVFRRGPRDDRQLTIELVDELAILCKELAPMIVLFFAPPYYPAVNTSKHPLIQRTVSHMIRIAEQTYGIKLEHQHYFGGISDLSYVGLQNPLSTLQPLVTNMPLWERGYVVPLTALEQFDVPVLNLGPIGRDAHQWTERLDVDFAFGPLMKLLPECIQQLLATETED
ncbi:M20/M25/M40 family metallo-hydrolase [Laceyella putida]|uniref:M20/M25/M40 family metallo-hydrolase n=1 Tax=Laceyella putida TaxID=110101 RepID=A0ABW2RIG3_9BACL